MNLETLQAKRTALVARRDQLVANVNVTSGAIAMCDEMIGEELAEQSRTNVKAAVIEPVKVAAEFSDAPFEKKWEPRRGIIRQPQPGDA